MPDLRERWDTFVALLQAAARVVRRHRRLLVFPLLVALVPALVYGLAITPSLIDSYVLTSRVLKVPPPDLRVDDGVLITFMTKPWFALLWGLVAWYAGIVYFTFVAVALGSAALQALRGDRVCLRRALAVASGRLPAILGLAALSAFPTAPFSAVERRSQWVVRATMAVFGLSWTLISLFAIAAVSAERIGPARALRRGAALVRSTWAEGRITTMGLGLMWLPLVALEGVGLSRLAGTEALVGAAWFVAGLNGLLWAGAWLLERVYVAAVYCYAVEGVVPEDFQDEELTATWRAVGRLVAAPELAEPRVAPVRRASARATTFTALSLVGGIGLFGYQAWSSKAVEHAFPAKGVLIDDNNFPDGPRLVAEHRFEVPGTLSGLTAVTTATGPVIFVAASDRLIHLDRHLKQTRSFRLPAIATDLDDLAALELEAGKGVLVGHARSSYAGARGLLALDWEGRVIFWRATDDDDGIDDFALVRRGPSWGAAVGYNGSYGLCYVNSQGQEAWCNREVGNVWVTSTFDCDGDGREEILSLTEADGGSSGARHLGCYDVDGRQQPPLEVPRMPYIMETFDLDGDGRKEVAFVDLSGEHNQRFGAFRSDGTVVREVIADPGARRWHSRAKPQGMRRVPGGPRDVVVMGPDSAVLGLSPKGERWQVRADAQAMTTVDLDGDGVEELITLGRPIVARAFGKPTAYLVRVWSWSKPLAWPEPRQVSRFARAPARLPRGVAPARHPVHAFARPVGRWLAPARYDVTLGCQIGARLAVRALPALAQPPHPEADVAACEGVVASLDLAQIDDGLAMGWWGCWMGITSVNRKYRVDGKNAQTVLGACWKDQQANRRWRP